MTTFAGMLIVVGAGLVAIGLAMLIGGRWVQ